MGLVSLGRQKAYAGSYQPLCGYGLALRLSCRRASTRACAQKCGTRLILLVMRSSTSDRRELIRKAKGSNRKNGYRTNGLAGRVALFLFRRAGAKRECAGQIVDGLGRHAADYSISASWWTTADSGRAGATRRWGHSVWG